MCSALKAWTPKHGQYARIYACMYLCICMYVPVYMRVCTCMNVGIYVCLCMKWIFAAPRAQAPNMRHNIYIYIYIHIYNMYVFMWCMYVYVCVSACGVCGCRQPPKHEPLHAVCMCLYRYVCMYVCMYVCLFVCLCVYMYTYVYTCITRTICIQCIFVISVHVDTCM